MKVVLNQEQFAKGLGIVSRTVDSRATLPVLANVLLGTEEGSLKLTATNIQLTVSTYVGAQVQQPGAITLPAKTLTELINNLQGPVTLTLDPATLSVNVRSGTTNSNIRGIAASEFPPSPAPHDADIVLPAGIMRLMIEQTVFAAAKDEVRPILTGLYIRFAGNEVTMAAADGFRLAVRKAHVDTYFDDPRELVVPARTLGEVARIIDDDTAELAITLPAERQMVQFIYASTVITSQLVEGRFPDFAAIIPKGYRTVVRVDPSDFLRQCKRAEIFARDNNFSARVNARPAGAPNEIATMLVTGRSNERGDNEGLIDAHVEGEPLDTAFNVRYLIDALSAMPSNQNVRLESNGAASPGVLRPEEGDDYICIIMPMSVNR